MLASRTETTVPTRKPMPSLVDDRDLATVNVPDGTRNLRGISGTVRSALQKNPRLEWLIPATLCAIMFGQLFLSARQLSVTVDETYHLYSGYRYLKCGNLEFGREHPPLARIVAAAPLLPMNLGINCGPVKGVASFSWGHAAENADSFDRFMVVFGWLSSQDWRQVLSRARMAASSFAVGLCLLVWVSARRMFGLTTAIVACLPLIFEPNILAFGSLVMTDVPVTCMMFLAVFAFYLWTRNRTAPYLLLTGLATGLTLLAKHSGVLVIPILCLLAAADAYIQTEEKRKSNLALRNLLAVGIVCVIAVGFVWGSYGMRFASGPPEAQETELAATSGNTGVLLALEKSGIENSRLLPQTYVHGFAEALAITNQPSRTFVAGKIYPTSPWFFVPLTLAAQLSAAFLMMIPLAVVGIVLFLKRHRREFLFLLAPVSVCLVVYIHAGRVGGIRHTLPIFPFLLIAVAAGCVELARRVRWVRYALACLIVLHMASSMHAYPNYLSYVNEFWGGPTNAYKYLGGPDIGQAYLQVNDYIGRHPAEPCWLLTGWFWNPGLYGVHCTPIGYFSTSRIPPRLTGTIIVSSMVLNSTSYAEARAVAPFAKEKPKDFIGGSALLVYEGDFDTRAAASMSAWRHVALVPESLDAELQESNEAVTLDPGSAPAHTLRCLLLAQAELQTAAISECETAIQLATADSLHQDELSKLVEQAEAGLRHVRPPTNYPLPPK